MASVSTTISYPSAMDMIPYDRGQQITDADPLAPAFIGVYDNTSFSANVTFSISSSGGSGGGGTYVITGIQVTLPSAVAKYDDAGEIITEDFASNLTYNITGSTVSISGEFKGLLNEYYTFVMGDKSVRDLLINSTEDWASVVQWTIPSQKELGIVYTFVVSYTDALLEVYQQTIVIPQWIYWHWQPSLQALSNFVKNGDY